MLGSGDPNYVEPSYPEPYTYADPDGTDCDDGDDCDERRLQETSAAVDTFKTSRFYEMGGSDFVLVSAS